MSRIEWTGRTWNPIKARNTETGKVGHFCEKISPGCKNCYASTWNARGMEPSGNGLPYVIENRSKVEYFLDETTLLQPLRWKSPQRIFVESMSDLFGDWVPDEWIDRIFGMMSLCPHHTFQVLTKRAERMRIWECALRPDGITAGIIYAHYSRPARYFPQAFDRLPLNQYEGFKWPLPNVWLGVSIENQQWAEMRLPELGEIPAAIRFLSVEPILGPVNLTDINLWPWLDHYRKTPRENPENPNWPPARMNGLTGETSAGFENDLARVDWVIVGGESGPGARPCNMEHILSIARQCKATGTRLFVKQWGSNPIWDDGDRAGYLTPKLKHKKGADPLEWPEEARVREFPEVA